MRSTRAELRTHLSLVRFPRRARCRRSVCKRDCLSDLARIPVCMCVSESAVAFTTAHQTCAFTRSVQIVAEEGRVRARMSGRGARHRGETQREALTCLQHDFVPKATCRRGTQFCACKYHSGPLWTTAWFTARRRHQPLQQLQHVASVLVCAATYSGPLWRRERHRAQ